MNRKSCTLVTALILAALAPGCASTPTRPTRRSALIISIDGLRPEFYRDRAYPTPQLKALADHGASFDGLVPVFPSLTYPNHTTIASGQPPARHGVINNRVFSDEKGPTSQWYLDSSWIRVPTVWDLAQAQGRRVALLNWPATRGARAEWVLPEVFPEDGFEMAEIWKLTVRHTDPALLHDLVRLTGEVGFTGTLQHDRWMASAARSLLQDKNPDLLLVHLTHVDVTQHLTGRDSPATHEAIAAMDGIVGELLRGIDLSSTCALILGDHGFVDIHHEIRLNALFAAQGWVRSENRKITDWKVLADVAGAAAAIYARDPSVAKSALDLLRKNERKGHYRVIPREELDRLGAFPGALCAIEPENGFAVSADPSRIPKGEPWVVPKRVARAEHGQLGENPLLHAGLIAVGSCAKAGARPGTAHMEDIAPTIAEWMGLTGITGKGTALDLGRNR